jgi:predicted transcriptional regulator
VDRSSNASTGPSPERHVGPGHAAPTGGARPPSRTSGVVRPSDAGYTRGMKIAVSVPDDVFERAERLARRAGRSRSEVYSSALREYVARHAPDEVTETLDAVVADVGETADPFVSETGRRQLETTEW